MTMRMSESFLVCFVLVSSSFQVACNSSNFGAAFQLGKKPRPAPVDTNSSGNSTKDMEAVFDETLIDTFNKNDEYVQKNLGDDTFTIHGVEFSNLASFYEIYRDQIESSPYAEVSLRETLEDAGIDIEDLEVPSDESERAENYQDLSDTIESRLNGENKDANGENQDALSLQVNTPQRLRLQGDDPVRAEGGDELPPDKDDLRKAASLIIGPDQSDPKAAAILGGVLGTESTKGSKNGSTDLTIEEQSKAKKKTGASQQKGR